jgi:hypothetical protein
MQAAGITLSTVGAGGGGAGDFLGALARQGGGRYYAATDPASIPDIFLKETQQVSGQQIVEEDFFPILTSSSPILRGLEDGLPQLRGYNGTTAKAAAQTVLVSSRDDPVLAQWQYGLGRSVAWTSDGQGRWAANWVGWDGFNKFMSQLVSWTFPGEESGGMEAEFITEGDDTKLQLRSVESDGTPRNFFDTVAGVTDPNLSVNEVRLDQVAPGVYQTDLGSLTPGAYALRFVQTKPGETPLRADRDAHRPDDRPSTGSWAPTNVSSPRCVAPLAEQRSRTAPPPGSTTWARPRRDRSPALAVAPRTPASGRSTWLSGVFRSRVATLHWLVHGRRPMAPMARPRSPARTGWRDARGHAASRWRGVAGGLATANR